MNPRQRSTLRDLLEGRRIAALGTLHGGAPFVSMTPFAVLAHAAGFAIHVSALSSHTADMLEDPRVSLLIVAAEEPEAMSQALARVTIQGRARKCARSSAEETLAREAYLARFPQAGQIAALPDFSFFTIRPESARYIPGFAQAMTLTPEKLAAAVAAP